MDRVKVYHDATKHHPHRYAKSLGYLDWATQPDPFRRFEGAELVSLEFGPLADEPRYEDLYCDGAAAPQPVNRRTLSAFFECSLAISAWKSYTSSTWALRVNPSSGNLHPTEGYVVFGAVDGIGDLPAVYHYAPREHGLERRHSISEEKWRRAVETAGEGAFFVGLTSILWREAWKYGERAFRYCQHDVGHALACLRLSASRLGWQLRLVEEVSDDDIARLLGLDRDEDFTDAEREEPELLALISALPALSVPDLDLLFSTADGPWFGRANRLSKDHVDWDIIDMVADATRKPRTPARPKVVRAPVDSDGAPIRRKNEAEASARDVILRRRSATDFDGQTSISADLFYQMLARIIPDCARPRPPWDAIFWKPRIDLAMFVHRVVGIPPGLYALVRNPVRLDRLRRAMKSEFEWSRSPECPADLPLYHLMTADARRAAMQLSLGQAIAGDSAFSFGMLADFDGALAEEGPWFYRRLFWEAGMIGQVLYLEPEAAALRMGSALRATGIGAYFDDLVHDVFGLEGHAFQSMYHFTVGGAVEDTRLTTRPPYEHLAQPQA